MRKLHLITVISALVISGCSYLVNKPEVAGVGLDSLGTQKIKTFKHVPNRSFLAVSEANNIVEVNDGLIKYKGKHFKVETHFTTTEKEGSKVIFGSTEGVKVQLLDEQCGDGFKVLVEGDEEVYCTKNKTNF